MSVINFGIFGTRFFLKILFSLNVFIFEKNINFAAAIKKATLSDGVIGNTSDFGSEESRFETWSDNHN